MILPKSYFLEKDLVKNYCPVSLLLIFGKFFERLKFNSLFKYIDENELLNPYQSGFRPFDSCVNQLLSINHEIFSNFDCDPPMDIHTVFLDISKAFDKIWLPGFIFKIKSFGISGDFSELIKNFLSNRFQRVVLNEQTSEWEKNNAGVPQGSILGPLIFLIYINDLTDGISSIVKLFADDTSLFSVVQNKNNSASQLNNDLDKVSCWAYTWKMSFNPDPSKEAEDVVFSRKCTEEDHFPIYFNDISITQTTVQKHIGLDLDEKLNYNTHIKEKLSKVYKDIGLFRNLPNKLPRQVLVTIYKVFIRPHLGYGDIVYDKPNNERFINKIEKAQYDAALAITGVIRGTSWEKLYAELGLESLKFRRWFRKLACFYEIQSTGLPKYLLQLTPTNNHSYILRKPFNIPHYYCRTDTFKNSFFHMS